jgi:8-oxo-dGTP diphosphatase
MRYYIESDGRVFLVDRGGVLDLPQREEIPFLGEEIAPLGTVEQVVFFSPCLDRHPHEWPSKDDLSTDPRASALVREAVHASMPRVVVEGVCLEGETILLVKGSRGLTEGRWSLPGGFLRFGETPEEGVRREVEEELGVTARVDGLLDVKGRQGPTTRLQWVMIFFRVSLCGVPSPNPDEIAEARYFPLSEARHLLFDDLMREAIALLLEKEPPLTRGRCS